MAHLNRELQQRINKLQPLNKVLLEELLLDLSKANSEIEKKDAIQRLRSKVRESVVVGEKK